MRGVDYKIIYRKARILLGRMPWRKILAFSFCLLLSASFWFIKIYRQSFSTTFDIPIKYVHIPDSIVFDNEFPSKVNVSIKDNGSSLFNYYFTKRNDTIVIDVASLIKTPSKRLLQGAEFKQVISNYLLPSSFLISYIPDNISFTHTKLFEKKVPVIFDGQVSLAAGYLLNGDIEIYPDSVRAYGSQSALETLHYAYTINDTVEDLKTEAPLIYPIKKVKNIRFIPNQISVKVPVDKYTQKTVSVPIVCMNLPEDIDVKFFPSRVNVSFLVGLSKYESIDVDDFLIQFDYEELKNLKKSLTPIRIVSSPDYVSNLSLSPTETDFIFEKK